MGSKNADCREISKNIMQCDDNVLISNTMLLRCLELAKIVEDEKWIKIFTYEVYGYKLDVNGNLDDDSRKYCKIMGRFYHVNEGKQLKTEFVYKSVEQLKLSIEFDKNCLKNLTSSVIDKYLARDVNKRIKIKTDILRHLQIEIFQFASNVYNNSQTDDSPDIFTQLMAEVTNKLNKICPKSSETLESILSGLKSQNSEEWKNSVHSCRGIFVDLSEKLYTISGEEQKLSDGSVISVKKDQYMNRLIYIIDFKSRSKTNKKLLFLDLTDLFNRFEAVKNAVCKGSHAITGSISQNDAIRYVCHTYLLLWDILQII